MTVGDLARCGFRYLPPAVVDLSTAELIEESLVAQESQLAANGALVALTGARTGRSPQDKFTVRDSYTESRVDWTRNAAITPDHFQHLLDCARSYIQSLDCIFLQHGFACADEAHRLSIGVVAEKAWHALFAKTMFLRPTKEQKASHPPEWLILALPSLRFNPELDRTHSDAVIAMDYTRKMILIAGTHYAGEIKKAVFTLLNGILPEKGVFPMHCSANVGEKGDVALFFGLSGTGKTTLSAEPSRRLIGDDEHGWSDTGIFNIEGGCYAKTIRLSAEKEPQIYSAIRFGSILENVVLNPQTREPDYNSAQLTENTRVAYPVEFIPNCELSGRGGHPSTIFFLTCDALGVLPPISRLTPDQAMDHFLCGYTAKVAGTESGVVEPTFTFSTCFGAPFLPLPPKIYAKMLSDKMQRHNVPVYLVNTGWSGGPPGVGERMPLELTRTLLSKALDGSLNQEEFISDPIFGLAVPKSCPGVESEKLHPRSMWQDPTAYDQAANRLKKEFQHVRSQYN